MAISRIIGIDDRMKELINLQEQDPDRYPDFLGQLLDQGYIRLYDHIIEMRKVYYDRAALRLINEKMTLKKFTEIVIDTREAVVQKVKKSIPPNITSNMLLILGNIGWGISTTACFLGGKEMILSGSSSYDTKEHPGQYIRPITNSFSKTFLPNIHINNGLATVDMAGFDYRDSIATNLGLELALKAIISEYHPRIMVVTPGEGHSFQSFRALDDLSYRLDRIFENKTDFILGLTHYTRSNFSGEKLQCLKEQHVAYIMDQAETESTIKNRIGLSKSIRIVDLQNAKSQTQCQSRVSEFESQASRLNPDLKLDGDHRDYLIELFKKEIFANSYSIPAYNDKISNFAILKQLIQERSLTAVLMPDFYNEMLRLPEFDSALIKESMDLCLINACLFIYIEALENLWLGWLEIVMRNNKYFAFANKINALYRSRKWEIMCKRQGDSWINNINKKNMLLLPCMRAIEYVHSKAPFNLQNFTRSLTFKTLQEVSIADDSFVDTCEIELDRISSTYDKLVEIQSMLTEYAISKRSIKTYDDLIHIMREFSWYDKNLVHKTLSKLTWFTCKDLIKIANDPDRKSISRMLVNEIVSDPQLFDRIIKTENDFQSAKAHFSGHSIFSINSKYKAAEMVRERKVRKEFSQVGIAASTLSQAQRDQYSFFRQKNIPIEMLVEIAIHTADFSIISKVDARGAAIKSFNTKGLNNSIERFDGTIKPDDKDLFSCNII